jgi:hypothetical protein
MQALADPKVRIHRIHFATAGPHGTKRVLPALLPTDRGLVDAPLEESDAPFERGAVRRKEAAPRISVELRRKKGEERTRYEVLGQDFDDEEACVRRVAQILAADPKLPLELNAWAWVPFGDVVRVLDAYRKTGRGVVTFVGAPPIPGSKRR